MSNNIELIEEINAEESVLIESPILDGKNINLFRDFLIDENDGAISVADNSLANAVKVVTYYVNSHLSPNDNTLKKTLCIGRVQSGKTSFFLGAAALAFDNGYNLVYLIGGTKNSLRDQNLDRTLAAFENNIEVKVFNVNDVDAETVENLISLGYKIVLVVLKNAADSSNLGKLKSISESLYDHPVLVIDDEGDEYTPGAPRFFNKTGRIGANHDLIQYIIYSMKICTFLSVTATPQANFLIDTFDAVSPDYCILVEPGSGYTGGNAFHDTDDNPHVEEIFDTDNFLSSIPESFEEALFFFLFAISYKRINKDSRDLSMLIHPSSLNAVQSVVADKIKSYIDSIQNTLSDVNNVEYTETLERIYREYETYIRMNPLQTQTFPIENFAIEIQNAINEIGVYEYNITMAGRTDINKSKEEERKYKIYVGGNMLGRGLTIKNLCVTYMYRDSKVTAIDTLYQRARWLGYKKSYFDICRVYMTQRLKSKFISIVNSENDMWNALRAFLSTKINANQFNRIFTLDDEEGRLILTRKSIAKTITLERVTAGYQYDKSMHFSDNNGINNRVLELQYRNLHEKDYKAISYSTSSMDTQRHLVLETTFSEFYSNFLSDYKFPFGSNFGHLSFEKILNQVNSGKIEDKVKILVMRYEKKQYRSCISVGGHPQIKELPQSWDDGSNYPGDKFLPDVNDCMSFQIHLVYTDKNNPDDYYPILAFNNPITTGSIRYVTGDGVYEN